MLYHTILFVDINALTKQGESALHLAVRAGHCLVIELLVNHGIDGSIKNKDKYTAVHLAVQLQKHDCLQVSVASYVADS